MRVLLPAWVVTRVVLLLYVFQVFAMPGPLVTTDIEVIYQNWFEVLRTGVFPQGDVTWQYPPGAALAILSPGLLPFWEYATAFFALALVTDALVFTLLLRCGRGEGRSLAGAWVWLLGVPLLGPTAYARYDLMVTAVAVAAVLAGARHPRVAGALIGFGAMLKVWPALLLVGTARGRTTRVMWASAAASAAAVAGVFALTMPGALGFLTAQRDRGIEVESVGALVFHVARHLGWEGEVLLNYGSMEFLGPHVDTVSTVSMLLTVVVFGWLVWWRLYRLRPLGDGSWAPTTYADAAFAAVLLFTTTSRVISPQYMLWLVGLAAVCMTLRSTYQRGPAVLVIVATGVTLVEFPLAFGEVVSSEPLGVTLLFLRNGMLVAACAMSCAGLWRSTAEQAPPVARESGEPPARRQPDPLLTW